MKIYRSIDLGALELSQKLNHSGVSFFYEPMSDEDLLQADYDLIELSEQQSQSLLSKLPMLDLETQMTMATDAFVKVDNILKPMHLNSKYFASFLEAKKINLDISKNAVLVGGYTFLMTFAVMLAKLGYRKIYLISTHKLDLKKSINHLQKYLLNINIKQLSLDEMANSAELASLLAVDFDVQEFPEAAETVTYFNFMSEKALFFDAQDFSNNALSVEAEKASLLCIDSAEFHLYKYQLFQKNFK